jgi:hypothetical protein
MLETTKKSDINTKVSFDLDTLEDKQQLLDWCERERRTVAQQMAYAFDLHVRPVMEKELGIQKGPQQLTVGSHSKPTVAA